VPLSNAADGNHLFDGDQKFGVMIYGYGQYTSYWYPGGLDLNSIPQ
jgi:homospermidine synthase